MAPKLPVATRARPLLASAEVGGEDEAPIKSWLLRHRSLLLLVALVVHKCTTDCLTRYTRLQTSYSGATVAVMSEIFKFPLIGAAICMLGGGAKEVIPTIKAAASKPFNNVGIALCYTFNNLLYFDALSAISAVAYQVLSQSKTVFTAGLMYIIVGKKLLLRQLAAIAMLIGGALLVQMQELARAGAGAAVGVASSTVMWGAFYVLFSSFISALPNVAYEKVLKTEGESEWVNNVQVTVWIMLWIGVSHLIGIARGALTGSAPLGTFAIPTLGSLLAALEGSFAGFTPAVWAVIVLKSLNGLLIPATLKYADNILYSYAKPSSIVLTTLCAALLTQSLPSTSMLAGVALVVSSIFLYSSKPKAA